MIPGVPAPDPETGVLETGGPEGGRILLLPTLHQKLEFAVLARRAFRRFQPGAVAVELPRTIEDSFRRAVLRLPLLSVVLYPDGDETVYLPVEPHEAMVEAARLALENGTPLAFVDRDDGTYPLRRDSAPDPYALVLTGAGAYLRELLAAFPPSPDDCDSLRERAMAFRLAALAREHGSVLWVGGVAHARGLLEALVRPLAEPIGRVKREGVRLTSLAHESAREVMSEIPWLSASFERARSGGEAYAFDAATDAPRALDALLRSAEERYLKERRGEIPPRAFEVLRAFSRNLAIVEGALTPGFFELVVAARGAVDDDFAWIVWDLGSDWPWPDRTASLPEVRLTGEDLFVDGKKVRFRRRFSGKGARLRRLPVRSRPREKKPGDWAKHRFGSAICSYPPEDLAIEGYGNRLRRRALDVLSGDSRRVQPLSTSLLDGVDVRESLRRWHEGRLWVFEERLLRGGAGSVVVVFDEDDAPYAWRTTWLGEHGQESDMAFYATPAGDALEGPGISRCTYGAFVMTMPPGRLADVWSDHDYDFAQTPAERLLLAAIDYAVEPRIVYVAAKPPRPAIRRLAARFGRQVVYLPMGSVSSATMKRLRTFRVLANRGVRAWAKDYVPR